MQKEKNYFQEKYKDFLKIPKEGDFVKGKVIQKGKGGIVLELGNFKMGIIKKDDLIRSGQTPSGIKIGEEITAKIVNLENDEGFAELSLREATEDLNWKKLEELNKKGEKLSLKVYGANKGGLIFNVSGLQGFLPASQLSAKHYPKLENPSPDKVFEKLKELIGEEIEVKIITLDPKKARLILSER
ncbi:MAG TPA: S1 RNA-binding domain-containing protein [Candidatus Paceibacterota bacterium]|nr:S1 RNA-binding domain-containing protein [Candidatus Paceibacterota bacterium]